MVGAALVIVPVDTDSENGTTVFTTPGVVGFSGGPVGVHDILPVAPYLPKCDND